MSKAYPSNLTQAQFDLLNDLLPAPKPGGRPRTVALQAVLNALFYLLCEGCRWRALPGDFPAWQTVYTYFRNWRKDGTWIKIHDHLREWVRIEQARQPGPSEAVIDSQSVKSAAMVSESVGWDGGKLIKGRKRFLTVETLGLVLRVLVTAASVGEREGGKQVLKRVKKMDQAVSRLHTIWVDGGFDGAPFMQWVMDVCRWICAGSVATGANQRLCAAQKAVGSRANFRLADGMSPLGQRLRVVARNFRDVNLPCHDSAYGQTLGIKFDRSKLSKHPLRLNLVSIILLNLYHSHLSRFLSNTANLPCSG